MQRASIYARYSSGAQRPVSIDQQVQACRSYAAAHDIEIVEIYEDRALTGTSDKRPAFQRMIRDSAKGNWEYVIVYTLDRFARNRYDSATYRHRLKENGVRLLSALENISDDITGVLMESVLEGFAEYYSRQLAEKTKGGMRHNAKKCLVNGPTGVGYVRGSDGRYEIFEPEAAVMREVWKRVRDGETISDIESDLRARDLRTRKGGFWTRNILYRMLSNERNCGVYIYGDVRIEGGIPAIVPPDLFYDVYALLENKPNPRRELGSPVRRRNADGLYLLTGKAFCGKCSSPMVGVSGRSKTGAVYHYYSCRGQKAHQCDKASHRRDQLEYQITCALKEYIFKPDVITALADSVIAHQGQSDIFLELDSLRAQLSEVNSSTKNLLSAIERGIFTAAVQDRLLDLEQQGKQISHRIDSLERQTAHLMTRDDVIALLSIYQDGNPEDKSYQQTILDTFLRAVYIYDDHFDIVFTLGDKLQTSTIPLPSNLPATLSEYFESSYNLSCGSPTNHIRTQRLTIFVFCGIYAFRCSCIGKEIHA